MGLRAAIDGPDAFAQVFGLDAETIAHFARYESLLRKWQRAVNLVAPNTLDEIWQRHFADSAQLVRLAPAAKRWLDLGSGGGFPGLAVAILLAKREGVRVHLVESNARKCAFLAEAARKTGSPVEIHQTRIEALAGQSRVRAPDVVTARALAPLSRLLDLAAPFFGPATRGLFPKGREAAREIAAARRAWTFECRQHPSLTEAQARVVEVSRLATNQGGDVEAAHGGQ